MPALALLTLAIYVALASGSGCQAGTPQSTGACATDAGPVAVVAVPVAVICLVLAAAVLRGAPWARLPAIGVGAVLGTVVAAGALAGVVALAGDSYDLRGAVVLGVVGFVVALACALPPLLLAGGPGAAAFGEDRGGRVSGDRRS